MADFLFYLNKKERDPFGKLKLPENLQLIYSFDQRCRLFSSISKKDVYHISSEKLEFILLGNFTFYKGVQLKLDLLIQNNAINFNEIDDIFRKINGTYCCIIFDKKSNQINLISDYLGFYPIYFYEDNEMYVFSSELKYFKLFDNIDLNLDERAIDSYLYNGHLMLNQTWFQLVKRARPATIYTLNFNDGSAKSEYYWTWANVRKGDLPKAQIIERYSDLFTKAITDLDLPANSKNAISLSGGLDSRWIAQIASAHFRTEAFTFSTGKNNEMLLSKKVSEVLNIKYYNPVIEAENWLMNRLQAFWKTDGMLHLGHLHEGNIYKKTHAAFSHCFHGFYGGGIYAAARECNQQITDDIAKTHFIYKESRTHIEDPYYNVKCIDPYIVDQKIRYQSALSIYLLSSYCKMVIPFYNMDWLEFNYSIDDQLQLNSKLYLEVLKGNLSDKLLDIPWQRTGIPPKYIGLNVLSLRFKIPAILESVSQRFHSSRHFINYHAFDQEIDYWIRAFQKDILNLQIDFSLYSRERKIRMLSLVVWLKMISKNSPDVL